MLTAVRQRWGRARRLHMTVTQVVDDNAGATTTSTPVGTGAFAALLVEWRLAQRANDAEGDRPTLNSA
jgi:hypothetical protein